MPNDDCPRARTSTFGQNDTELHGGQYARQVCLMVQPASAKALVLGDMAVTEYDTLLVRRGAKGGTERPALDGNRENSSPPCDPELFGRSRLVERGRVQLRKVGSSLHRLNIPLVDVHSSLARRALDSARELLRQIPEGMRPEVHVGLGSKSGSLFRGLPARTREARNVILIVFYLEVIRSYLGRLTGGSASDFNIEDGDSVIFRRSVDFLGRPAMECEGRISWNPWDPGY